MSAKEISRLNAAIERLREWETIQAEAAQEVENLKDLIKATMLAQETEELEVGTHIVRWTTTLSNRFDTTAFKKVMPDVYKAYTRQVTSRRFTISD